jgi:hypothetical protein
MRSTLCLLLLAACSDYALHSPTDGSPGGERPASSSMTQVHRVVDSWTLTQSGGVDVLFFGDTSGSMSEELQTLSDEILTFMSRLDHRVGDWQLLAVTGPEGCGLHGVIGAADPDAELLFTEAISTPPGMDLVDEWGLYSISAALQQTGPGDCNEGFLREDALLHVIFVSDEDDNSPGWDAGNSDYWMDYLDQFIAIKGEPDQVLLSGITGPSPNGCEGADPGTGYNDAVLWTGGELLSICDEWSAEVDILADAGLLHQSEFYLSERPISATLTVTINGHVIPAGWTYDADSDSVVFHGGAPRTGDQVEISYRVVDD